MSKLGEGCIIVSTPWEEQAHKPELDAWLDRTCWLGGSPCAGKSSVADLLAERYGLAVYRCDDAYFRHTQLCNPQDQPTLHAITAMSWDEIWMRPVDVQVTAEFAAYREEFPMILADLRAMPHDRPLLVEGCALLPELVGQVAAAQQALWFVPTPAFQRRHYAQRGFIQEILAQCRDPQQAWANWMDRDEQFGREVAAAAAKRNFVVAWVDGERSSEELTALAAAHFGLRS